MPGTDPMPLNRQTPLRNAWHSFASTGTSGAIALVAATAIAMLVANSAWAAGYQRIWQQQLAIGVDAWTIERSLL